MFQATDDCRNQYITLDAFYNVQDQQAGSDQTLPGSGILAHKSAPTSRLNLKLIENKNEGSQASGSDTAWKSADHTVLELEVLETELKNVAARLEGSLAETRWHKSEVRRKKNELKKGMIGKEASVVVEGLNQPTHRAQWSDLGNVSLQYDSPFTSKKICTNLGLRAKFLKLLKCLEGEPAKLIECMPCNRATCESVKHELLESYGGVRRQLSTYLADLDKFKQLKDNDAQGLRRFGVLMDWWILHLTHAGQKSELESGAFYMMLTKKLSFDQYVDFTSWLQKEVVRSLRRYVRWKAALLT